MKKIVSIFLLTYPILVFADKIYFKNDTSIEGEIIDYKGDYITFKLDSINDVQYPLGSVIKMIDSQTIQFSMEYVYMVTDSDGEIIATRTGQDELLTKWESKTQDKIKKTKFLAVTNYNGKKFFIGSNGKLINFQTYDKNLPYVFGKVKIKEFIKFTKIIANSKFNFEEISELYFFPSGRWDIKTNKDILIKLPQKNLLKVLNLSYQMTTNENFKNKKIIDLRIYNNVISTNE